ncbi:MAG: FAD binding domain-containing protein [Chloroflexota bacterium]
MWEQYYLAASVDEALALLTQQPGRARLVAGATDLVLELEHGLRPGVETLVDISRLPGMSDISLDEDGFIHIGPLVTHNDCVGSRLLRTAARPLVEACWQVGSPQIRNRGTLAGNLVTASPANDTIGPLMALGSALRLQSSAGERLVPLSEFYTGVRKTVLQPEEMLVDITFPAMRPEQHGGFVKLALRNSQAISVINVSLLLTFEGEVVSSAAITLGAVAPVIVHAQAAQDYLVGKRLDAETIEAAARLTGQAARPISDVRASADYRQEMVRVCARRGLEALGRGECLAAIPDEPVLLCTEEGPRGGWQGGYRHADPLRAVVNGMPLTFVSGQHKTLANLLRDEGQLPGTKIACGEGECGACTVFLDGKAVMSCLVPGPRAHGAEIRTVEGIGREGALHPVQAAFLEYGAVQCGFCTPGFVMSAVKLLEEKCTPTHEDILHAISGNLCRCTGYYKIIEAIEKAAVVMNGPAE